MKKIAAEKNYRMLKEAYVRPEDPTKEAFRALVKLEPRRGERPTERLINAWRDGGVPREVERAHAEVVKLFKDYMFEIDLIGGTPLGDKHTWKDWEESY